jgi:murein DD-endopeptidase MepM/ murein hydrolase activator NlpD
MSKLEVKNGDHVEAGQLLGLSGMTGRANGPHLHWGVVINKVKVNPADFLKVVQ